MDGRFQRQGQPVTNLSGEDLHKELIGRLNVLVHFIDRLAGSSVGTSVGEDPRFQQMLNDVSPTKDLHNLLCDPGTTDDDIVTRAQTAGTALTSQGCMVQKCFCVYPAGARILDRMRALAGQYQKAKIQYNDLMRASLRSLLVYLVYVVDFILIPKNCRMKP